MSDASVQDEVVSAFCAVVDRLVEQHNELEVIADRHRQMKRDLEQELVTVIFKQSNIETALATQLAQLSVAAKTDLKIQERVEVIFDLMARTQGGVS